MKKSDVFFIFSHVLTLLLTVKVNVEAKAAESRVIVTLPLGKLEGEERKSLHSKNFFAFEGVPYAEPPTGENRFREPQEVKKWEDTKLVSNKTVRCIQLSEFATEGPPYEIQGEEDCLFLNIYSPNVNETANLDVIVFIHGGGFMSGQGYTNGPDYLLDENVVYVSLNHRVGPLGFLSTEDGVVPGNMGMFDQIMALKFVQKYIKYFGGNPKSVTLTGNSSGSSSVHFHMLSPLSKGLFNRGVSFSCTMLNQFALVENSREKAEKLAASLNCSETSLQKNINCLRTKPAENIVAAVRDFLAWMYTPGSPFGIVIDSWAPNPSLPEHPLKLIQQGKVQNVPWIVTHTNSEGLFPASDYYNDSILAQIDTQWNTILPFLLDYNYTVNASLHDSVSQKIRDYYMGNKTVSKKTFMDFVQIISDRLYIGDIVKTVKFHLKYVEDSSIQLYIFTYHGANSLFNSRANSSEDFGASHTDDASYLFYSFFNATTTEEDREMVKVMVKMLVSFARNGTADVGVDWPKATKEKLNRLVISGPKNLKIDREDFSNSSFWDTLPIMENERLFQSEIYQEF